MSNGLATIVLLIHGAAVLQRGPLPERGDAGIGPQLLGEPAMAAARERVHRDEPAVIADQLQLCEIPAPPFGEQARAARLEQEFQALGLVRVRIDAAGNVLGERPGRARRPHLVMSAHLDTVFPAGTPVGTSRSGTMLRGPGISDDCRGLAVLLGVIRAMNAARIQTDGTVTFVGTVGEEGLGDLRGVKQLFSGELQGQIDRFVSVDGAGLGVTSAAVASLRYRVAFKGPGGHSYADFGVPSPVHALGRAIARIADLPVPARPRTTFNVGRVAGGTSVNAIASEAWMEVDLRSEDPAALRTLEAGLQAAVEVAAADESARGDGRSRITVERTLAGDRPGGRQSPNAAIVDRVRSVTRALGFDPVPSAASTDANLPISLGIPALTIGGGGASQGSHTTAESFDTADSWLGTFRALLTVVALTRR